MSRIRVALVEDQALVRAGMSLLLRGLPSVELAGEYSDGDSAYPAIVSLLPDVVVSDIRMPGMNGIALTRALRAQRLNIPVLLVTTFEDPALFLEARKAGAQGFLLKDTSPDNLLDAIVTLHRGGTLFEPRSTQGLNREAAAPSAQAIELSARELEILRLMAGGYANKEIAAAIHLAEGTVKNYVSEIMTKLECSDRTRAVLKSIAMRLI
jgi:DNA-binding NarL/FixJ family response regulator